MISVIKCDENNNRQTYMCFGLSSNYLNIHGFDVTNAGVFNMNKTFIYELLETFLLGKESEQLDDYLGFKVYLDKKTGLKHYFKDGKENFSALFKFNGDNALNYEKCEEIFESSGSQNKNNKGIFKFKILGAVFICSASFILLLNLMNIFDVSLTDIKTTFDNLSQVRISSLGKIEYGPLAKKVNSVKEIQEYIYQSDNLTQSEKEFLDNEDLFNDILLYTYGTKMDYLYNLKLEGLEIKYFQGEEDDPLIGYYTMMDPNAINGKEGVEKKLWLDHEFIHLLQHPNVYSYICESTADIIAYEYYGSNHEGYVNADKNGRKLMDVIGPKIIWEYVFTGDATKLNNILRENLSEEDYKVFIDILEKNDGRDEELSNLIDKLYLNIYKSDIKSNQDIYDIHGNFIDKRIYFNESKMLENNFYNVSVQKGLNHGLVKEDDIIYYEIISSEEDNVLFEKYSIGGIPSKTKYEPLVSLDGCTIDNDGIVRLYYPNGMFATMSIDEAITAGILEKKIYLYLTEEQFNLAKDCIKEYEVITAGSFKEKMGNAILAPVKVYYQSIAQRFPNDTVRSQENNLNMKFNF
ncbi:MAG: hypothetical protein IJO33_00535 [Bacilli bacterium]|nr:hypothetical protein [Bacilli bacterium]